MSMSFAGSFLRADSFSLERCNTLKNVAIEPFWQCYHPTVIIMATLLEPDHKQAH